MTYLELPDQNFIFASLPCVSMFPFFSGTFALSKQLYVQARFLTLNPNPKPEPNPKP
jgi:hypothetical protein